jgi:hypothetical protein
VITASEDSDLIIPDLIDEPMLLVNPPRPTTSQLALQWFGFTFADEGVTLHVLNKFEDAQSFLMVMLDPPRQILEGR